MKMLGSKIIETKRLILKPQTMEEQEYLWSVLMIPEVNRLYLTVPRKFRDKLMSWEKQEPFYKADMEHANDPNVFRWSLFLKETGECIGKYSCQDGPYEETPEIRDVGWYIDPKHNGKGYGTEAAKAMIDYMFNECEIDEIITGAAIINPASWKIMEKLGFERLPETRMIDYTFMDEPVEDYQYHLTKEMYFRNR
jgi:RimJ/RimL family protein N-acetyltransferase